MPDTTPLFRKVDAIGKCAVVADPWGNTLVMLDMTKGRLTTDADGNVTGNEHPSS